MSAQHEITFLADGNTAVITSGRPHAGLEQPWVLLFAEYLETRGIDAERYQLVLPDGRRARFVALPTALWKLELSDDHG
jgi:hypothetical protein